jgi:lysophospholipase L1-like esterase
MIALLNLQNFADTHNFKLVIANGFNQRNEGIIEYLRNNTGSLCDKFDWSNYLHNTTEYVAFVQKLIELDNIMDANDWQGFHQFYFNRDWPAEYLTNCEGAHPTIKGYKVIADELAAFVKYKGYA